MQKSFTSGLVILLPITFTLMIINFLINLLTQPFLNSVVELMEQSPFFQHPIFYFHQTTLILFTSKMLILLFLMSFILLLGMLGRLFLMQAFLSFGDYLLTQLPFINKIYKACKDIVHSLFSCSDEKSSQVVLAPFPNLNSLSVGFVFGNAIRVENSAKEVETLVSVFIPGTPNPSVGFMLMFKKEQLLFVNMNVDEAMKFVISCGVVMPDFEILQTPRGYEKQFFNQSHILSCEG